MVEASCLGARDDRGRRFVSLSLEVSMYVQHVSGPRLTVAAIEKLVENGKKQYG